MTDGHPALTADGHTVRIVSKENDHRRGTISVDSDGVRYTQDLVSGLLVKIDDQPLKPVEPGQMAAAEAEAKAKYENGGAEPPADTPDQAPAAPAEQPEA